MPQRQVAAGADLPLSQQEPSPLSTRHDQAIISKTAGSNTEYFADAGDRSIASRYGAGERSIARGQRQDVLHSNKGAKMLTDGRVEAIRYDTEESVSSA